MRTYLAIDLKSFYASVECMERGMDPLTTHLVVADESRTEKTICLAVSPALKAYGISGRARLFEAVERVREINEQRRRRAKLAQLEGSSFDQTVLDAHPEMALDFVRARPQMAKYMEFSTRIYQIYLRYVAPEDIHVYSIDEVFMDITCYLQPRHMTARQFASAILQDVMETTGMTATAGIGSNLYLCKVALDVLAKHAEPDLCGARIAELDEMSYRRLLWDHRPLTDFWRVGHGYARKLEANGLFTMGDIALCSIGGPKEHHNEELLYHLFGVNAELLIDHAWGWEPCTIADVKAYKPEVNSLSTGQVLHSAYTFDKARLIVREMTDQLVLDLLAKRLVTDQLVLTIGYDIENLTNPAIRSLYRGPVVVDHYGRRIPKHAHGTVSLMQATSSARIITEKVISLYNSIVNPALLVRRITLAACRVTDETNVQRQPLFEQLDLFTDYAALQKQREEEEAFLARERRRQQAVLHIRTRYGKNAILRGMNLLEGATAMDRNRQIGGHKA